MNTYEPIMRDLRIDTYSPTHRGGWDVSTLQAVRIIHLPTGIEATSERERNQHRNKAVAFDTLVGLLKEHYSKRKPRIKWSGSHWYCDASKFSEDYKDAASPVRLAVQYVNRLNIKLRKRHDLPAH